MAALVIFNFWIWRSLRLEYESAQIFEVAFWLSVISIGGLWYPIIAVVAATATLLVYSKRLHIDFWQWWDTVLPIGLLLFAPIAPWQVAITMAVSWVAVWLVARFYRRFAWYKSGRLGFVGSIACLAWGIVQAQLAKSSPVWLYLAVFIGIAALTNIYLRSGLKLWQPKRSR